MREEAARLALRLEVAVDLLGAASSAQLPAPPEWLVGASNEVRHLLAPTLDRVTLLTELAHALADGTHSEDSARQAAEAIAELQPFRRPR